MVFRPLLAAKLSRLSPLFSFQGSPAGKATLSAAPAAMTPEFYQQVIRMSILFSNKCLRNLLALGSAPWDVMLLHQPLSTAPVV